MKPFLILFLLINSIAGYAQQPDTRQHLKLLNRVIEKNHFSPKALNDDFSSQLFD